MNLKRYFVSLLSAVFVAFFTLMPFLASAQGAEMADAFRKEGKIYIVILVIITIFIGIIIYLFSLEKKIKRLERDNNQ